MLDRTTNVKPTNLKFFLEATYKFSSFAFLAIECKVINTENYLYFQSAKVSSCVYEAPFFMPPTLKKLEGACLCVGCPCMRPCVCSKK